MIIDRKKRIRADLLLLTVSIIWGSAFVAQRLAAAQSHYLIFNGARFLLGALTVFLLAKGRIGKPSKIELRGGFLAGLILFGGAALQQAALEFTTAGKAGFITGTYVILIPIYLALVSRKMPRHVVWAGALAAFVGLLLLSVTEEFSRKSVV